MGTGTVKYIRKLMTGSFILLVVLFFLNVSYDIQAAAFMKTVTALLGLIILFSFVYSYGIVRTPLNLDVPGLPILTTEQKSFRETVEERVEKAAFERMIIHKTEKDSQANSQAQNPPKEIKKETTKEIKKTDALKTNTANLPPLPPLELDEKESFANEVPSKRQEVLNKLKNAHDINFFTEQKDSIQSYFTNVFDKKMGS